MANTMTSSAATAAAGGGDKGMSKSITRLLQHSILQLCNEHIGYNHKLQILGVLCMTVDDEQQELVVKVNNTLKRVNPINTAKEVGSGQMSPLTESGLPPPMMQSMMQTTTTMITSPESVVHTAKPSQMKSDVPSMSSRRSHGRKGTNPIKVHHVYDEGGMMSDDDDDILTVIPTDPEASISTSMLTPITTSQQLAVSTNSLSPGGASVEQFLMHDGEERGVQGSAKRKATYQLRVPQVSTYNDTARSIDCIGATSVRALLMKPLRASPYSGDEDSMTTASAVQDLSRHHSPFQSENGDTTPRKGLSLPVCLATAEDDSHGDDATNNENGPNNQSTSSEMDGFKMAVDGVIDFSNKGKSSPMRECNSRSSATPQDANRQFVGLDNDGGGLLRVKAEPKDDFGYDGSLGVALNAADSPLTSTPTHSLSMPNSYLGGVHGFVQHMLNSRLPTPAFTSGFTSLTSAAGAMASISASQPTEGLSIRYTSNGPVTVGANGKEVGKMTSRVKDIILYNDQSPLHMQKGNRIEADYMVDKLGMEGRKRRRRAPDESLTAEEIAEYMGQPGGGGAGGAAGTSGGAVSENMLFKCQFCLEEVRDLTRYLQHTLTVHNAYICHQCGKSFTTKSSLLRHRPIHTGMRRFACSICKKTFYRKDKCKAHIKRHLGLAADSQNVSHYQKIEPLA
ncbi:hypothetical protein NP493_1358g00007 [Ridgeia piscesae]|uniref:C2H2-type domain-containing protein n=1 Tax=Ridgeia piscesae TaxID=27915 RepID=A0AAD9ND38_RIDPI|nr:hypothetical protein NP493_1358g00007 [Ridgeia piscesae]